jgi:two-component system, response regulator
MEEKIILLVEDNPDDIELTRLALSKNNIKNQVVHARDGAQAIDYLFGTGLHAGRDTNIQPVLILLDLNIPKINGLEVLARLRADERTRQIPVVVLTCSREEQDLVESYRLGANSYVLKPIDFQKFLDAVKNLGAYWLVLNQPAPQRGKGR